MPIPWFSFAHVQSSKRLHRRAGRDSGGRARACPAAPTPAPPHPPALTVMGGAASGLHHRRDLRPHRSAAHRSGDAHGRRGDDAASGAGGHRRRGTRASAAAPDSGGGRGPGAGRPPAPPPTPPRPRHPPRWLLAGVLAMSMADIVLLALGFGYHQTFVLAAAARSFHGPSFTGARVGGTTIGYPDLFLAALLGTYLAAGRAQRLGAIMLAGLVVAYDSL